MRASSIVFLVAIAATATNALEACSGDLTRDLVNDPVFKQCDGMLANYFIRHHGLSRDDIRYVTGKTTVRICFRFAVRQKAKKYSVH